MPDTDWLHVGYYKYLIERLARISEQAWDHFETAATNSEDNKIVAGYIARMATITDNSIMNDLADFCDDTQTPELYDLYVVSKMIRDALLEPSPMQSPDVGQAFKKKGSAPQPH